MQTAPAMPAEIPHSPNDLPPSPGEQPSALRRWIMVGTAVLAVAGCDDPDRRSPEHGLKADTATEAGLIRQGVEYRAFTDLLVRSSPDLPGARQMIPALSQGNTRIDQTANRAVDAAYAGEILDNAKSSSEPKENGPKLSDVADLQLRGRVENIVYVFEAGKLVRKVSTTDFDINQAKTDLTARMPAGADSVRAEAEQALEGAFADDVASDYSTSSDDEERARAALANIRNPELRAAAARVIDGYDASQALTDFFIDRVTAEQVRADLANITDPAIRDKALKALAKAEAAGDRYLVHDTKTDLYLDASDAQHDLESAGDKFRDTEHQATMAGYDINSIKYDALDEIDIMIGEAIATANGIKPSTMLSHERLANPKEKIDLSGVKGTEKVANTCVALSKPEDKDDCGPATYDQFGELAATNGKLQLAFAEGSGMTPELRRHFDEAFENARPMLEAAFASGELVKVRYIVADDYNPFYVPATRELYIILPKSGELTRDQLGVAHIHEGAHALTRNLFAGVQATEGELRQLNAACNELRSTAYDDFEGTLFIHPEWLEGLRNKAKAEHRPLIDILIKAVKDGDLAGVLEQSAERLKTVYPSPTLNQCMDVEGGALDLLLETRDEAKLLETTRVEDLKYLFDTEEFKQIFAAWGSMLEYQSVFDRVIDESNYVEADYENKKLAGHSKEAAVEMCASLFDAAMNYRAQFTAGLGYLNNPEQADKREALLAALNFTLTYVGKYHPSLQTYMWTLRDNYLNMQ